jgi:hypothetical protein
MPLNNTGPISLAGSTAGQSIAAELGQSATGQISLNDSNVRTLAGVPSGVIIMPTDFYGKSNAFVFSFGGGTDVNLRSVALGAGWNGSSFLTATNTGTIQSSSTGTPALTINGPFPGGVSFINNSLIIGRGGNGGNGGPAPQFSPQAGGVGGSGGTAIAISTPVTVTNNSIISGGGGGGGGGGGSYTSGRGNATTAGGGGGGGIGVSSGGAGGTAGPTPTGNVRPGNPGGGGSTGGAGGGGSGGPGTGFGNGGPGGPGGGSGSSGSSGTAGTGNSGSAGGGGGGAAGSATSGNAFVTWVSYGTINGALN